MEKFIKNYLLMTILFLFVGIVYGALFNWVLRREEVSGFLAVYAQGILIGTFSVMIYSFLTFFFGYCFKQEYFDDALIRKTIMILINITAYVGLLVTITTLIANREPITLPYAWMHIVNMLFVGAVVRRANYDGKILRREVEKNNI